MSGGGVEAASVTFTPPVRVPVSATMARWQDWTREVGEGHWLAEDHLMMATVAVAAEVAGGAKLRAEILLPSMLEWSERDTGRKGWRSVLSNREADLIHALEDRRICFFVEVSG